MSEQSFNDLLLNMPPDGSTLPHVTPAILADAFAEQGVLLGGKGSEHRVIRWFVPLSKLDSCYIENSPVSVSQLLLAADPEDIPELSRKFPGAYLITQVEKDCSDCQLDMLRPMEKRLIALRKGGSNLHLLLSLQNLFLRMLLWENDLERIVLRNGTIDELLDASCSLIGNFIFVSDNEFNVIARTPSVDPPDDLHRGIIENGYLTQGTIAEKRFRLPEKTFYTREASELTPYDRVSYPVHANHNYLGSISMSCNVLADTEGLRDLFRILIRYVRIVFERMCAEQTAIDSASYFFFERLLMREHMSDERFTEKLVESGLPVNGHYKVIAFDVDPSTEPALAHRVANAATALHDGHVRCFPYQHRVVSLCFGSADDGELSHRKTLREVEERVHAQFGVECGVSSVFDDIRDMDVAYKQAQIALGFRGAIEREHDIGENRASRGVYLFEDALLYYLIDTTGKDERFIRCAFKTSIVNILWEEDQRNNTSLVALLWFYLQSERSASATANRLHMHRNTVIYHIEKIQKRFDFDMDDKTVRDWLLLGFKELFSSQSSESIASIFADE